MNIVEDNSSSLGFYYNKSKRLTMEIAENVRYDYESGEVSSIKELSEKYNLKRNTVKAVLEYRSCNPYLIKDYLFRLSNLKVIEGFLSSNKDKSNVTYKLWDEISDSMFYFKFNDIQIYLHKPTAFQIYFEMYKELEFIGSIQIGLRTKLEVESSKSYCRVLNMWIISKHIVNKSYTVKEFFPYINSISEYYDSL